MPKSESTTLPELEISRVSEGLGFGDGSISCEAIESQPGNEDLAQLTDEAINSPQILVAISKDSDGHLVDDDGCGDGRTLMQRFGAVFTKGREFAKSLFRPKVFGGGATAAMSMRAGLGEAKQDSLQQVFHDAINQLNEHGIDFGAHVDNKAQGENTGCGAIDKAPLIVATAVKYQTQIKGAIEALGLNTDGLNVVAENYASCAPVIAGQPYSGRQVIDEIIENDKVIKELADEHKETRIILNFVEGNTVNQEYFRAQTDGQADVFVVDAWRLKQLAEKLWPNPDDQHLALLSALTYTLATAAVLTKGDLPVYVISQKA